MVPSFDRDVDLNQVQPALRRYCRNDSQYLDKQNEQPLLSQSQTTKDIRSDHSVSRRKNESLTNLGTTYHNMAPPPPLYRERMAPEAWRRPRVIQPYEYDHDSRSPDPRRRSRREVSPEYAIRHPHRPSPRYSSEASEGRQPENADSDDEHIEVIIESGDESPPRPRRRRSSRDRYMDYVPDSRRHRPNHRGRHSSDDGYGSRRLRSVSPGESPVRESVTRRTEKSESPRKAPYLNRSTDVIEDSRPPVASKKAPRRGRRSVSDGQQDGDLQRSKSNRSRAGSTSSRRSGIFGGFFGQSTRRPAPEAPVKSTDCVVCMSEYSPSKMAKLRCGHSMCNSCLVRSFKLSVSDPQHMPPRCCSKQHIPLKHVDRLFDDGFKRNWNRKFAEYSTKNRVYCPSKKCGEWIKPTNISMEHGRKVGRCGRCKAKVCVTCNGKWHTSDDCPKDEETLRFLAQAQDEGWKRCYKCRAIVELEAGCNHMTCRCGAEFCMICGVKWKNCNCPWFTYNDDGGPADEPPDARHPTEPIRESEAGRFGPNPFSRERWPRVLSPRDAPRTYEEEMRRRRLQEQVDEEFARRLEAQETGIPSQPRNGDADWEMSTFDALRSRGLLTPSGPRRNSPPVERDSERDFGERHRERRFPSGRHSLRDRGDVDNGYPRDVRDGPPSPRTQWRAAENLYDGTPRRRRSERRSSRYYDIEEAEEGYRPRESRRRSRRAENPPREPPKSSTLAGLNGVGRGMNRVFEWRNFVEPGVPEGEGTPEINQSPSGLRP